MNLEGKARDVFEALKKARKDAYVPAKVIAETARCGLQSAKSVLLAAEKEGLVESVPVIMASVVGSGTAPAKAYRIKEIAR